MKTVLSAKDVESWLKEGKPLASLPEGALLTPLARDLIRQKEAAPRGGSPSPAPAGDGGFFHSREMEEAKERICEMGRRLWQRAYVDGNGGNMAVRVGEDRALCTPTLVSKGFMEPGDLCLVDLEGNQLAGTRKRTSEILMHLQIMKAQPRAKATVHCHPPHATAYAVAGVEPPTCMIPEIEVFVGKVPIAPYRTPGTPEMGRLVADLSDKHNTILMGNHGAVSWSHLGIEDAYFKMEILEAYCRTVWVASQLGAPLKTMSAGQLGDLLKIKEGMGIPDPRFGLKECELCDNDQWNPGAGCQAPPPPEKDAPDPGPGGLEDLVQKLTDEIMERMEAGAERKETRA